jgi:HK97 family phage prohead protease
MKTTESAFDLIVDYRENTDDGVIATLYGRAVPYDTPTMIGGVEETFAPASFDPTGVIGKPLAWRHDAPVGVITEAANEPDGLYITANILDTVQGRDAATLAKAGAVKGLSVGFTPIKSLRSKTGNAIRHITAQLMETSLTHMPAYSGAGITTIREETKMDPEETTEETTVVSEDKEAREAIAQVRESVAKIEARAFTSEPVHPLAQYRSFGEYSKAVLNGEVESRALFDQVTGDNPGVMPPNWMLQVMGIIDLGRRVINGVGGPQSAGTAGMDINFPYFDGVLTDIVEAQANEKDEVNSVQISIEKGTATLATYAAGSDISYQLLQRSSPSYLDAHNRIMAASYATVTDRKFTKDLWDTGTGIQDYDFAADTTGAGFREAVFAA